MKFISFKAGFKVYEDRVPWSYVNMDEILAIRPALLQTPIFSISPHTSKFLWWKGFTWLGGCLWWKWPVEEISGYKTSWYFKIYLKNGTIFNAYEIPEFKL